MEQTVTKVIEIENGNEYRILVDDIYSADKFFYPVYRKSSELVNEIYVNNLNAGDPISGSFPNNIIMYCAERGSGKSSAMASFAKELRELPSCHEKNLQDFTTDKNRWNEIKNNCDFTVLDVIDPTLIGEKEMFMRVILSRLFMEMRRFWETNDSMSHRADSGFFNKMDFNKAAIVEKFEKCYRLLDVIYQKGGEFDSNEDLYDLADLGDSSYLRKELSELVKNCLEELHSKSGNNKSKNFLVIQIDDTDLNTKMAYNIIEDIRKYCIIPNVIILMAVNIEQMSKVIEQHFITDFKTLLDMENKSFESVRSFDIQDCRNMAVKYIDKVMPAGHRINLPRIDDLIRNNSSSLTVKYMVTGNDGKKNDLLKVEERLYNNNITEDYQERLIRLIYRKTSIALVKPKNYLHNILPSTLRELAHFLSYMHSLPDINIYYALENRNVNIHPAARNKVIIQEDLNEILENINDFEKYFIYTWCKAQLSQQHYTIIYDLIGTASDQKIAFAIGKLEGMLPKDAPGFGEAQDESRNSYAMLQKKIDQFIIGSGNSDNMIEIYRFSYALRFYFMLFFYREYFSHLDDLSSLFRAANYEFWTSYLSEYSSASKYGLFEVNYNIFSKVCGIKSYENELKKCCYINIRGVNHAFDIRDPFIKGKLRAVTNNLHSVNAPKIYFDVAYEMLNCSYSNFFPLAFSWDLQSMVDKAFRYTTKTMFYQTDTEYMNGWESFMSTINWASNHFPYRLLWLDYEIDGKSRELIQYLQLSNRELAVEFVTESLESINQCFASVNFPEDQNQLTPFIESIEALHRLGREMNELNKVSAISSKVKKLADEWADIEIYFSKLEEFVMYFINNNNNLPPEIESGLYSVAKQMRAPFEAWKAHIQAPDVLEKIKSQIIYLFDNNDYPNDEPEEKDAVKALPLNSEADLPVQSKPKRGRPRKKSDQ